MKSIIRRSLVALGITAGALSVVSCSDPGTTYLPATVVYVPGSNATITGTVQQYTIATASGSATSTATLTLPTDYLVQSLATDVYGNLYVGAYDSKEFAVFVYPPNPSATAVPTRTITLGTLSFAYALAVDASGRLYVATPTEGSSGNPVVNVYAANASGTATPLRTVQLTDFSSIAGLAVDDSGGIYISGTVSAVSTLGSAYAIAVYVPTTTGTTALSRSILSSNPVYGVAADDSGDIYANMSLGAASAGCSLEEFGPTANGSSAVPSNTISLPLQSAVGAYGGAVQLDRAGNVFTSLGLVYSSSVPVTPIYSIYGYTPLATTNSVPGLSFTPVNAVGQVFAVN